MYPDIGPVCHVCLGTVSNQFNDWRASTILKWLHRPLPCLPDVVCKCVSFEAVKPAANFVLSNDLTKHFDEGLRVEVSLGRPTSGVKTELRHREDFLLDLPPTQRSRPPVDDVQDIPSGQKSVDFVTTFHFDGPVEIGQALHDSIVIERHPRAQSVADIVILDHIQTG